MSWQPNNERRLLFTDLETTGDVHGYHEIIEMGAVLAAPDLTTIEEYSVRVVPAHPERMSGRASECNQIDVYDNTDTIPLPEALRHYNALGREAIFVSHASTFDWGFLERAYQEHRIDPALHYHRLDTLSMAWMTFGPAGIRGFSLDAIARHLGLEPEGMPHRAINGARKLKEVYEAMLEY